MPTKNLEKLIKQQKPFPNEFLKAEVGLIFITNALNDNLFSIIKEHKITVQQYNVLRILRGQHPEAANINLIKERMLDKMSDASRIVDRLVKLDFVEKKRNDLDKRNTDVFISNKALELLIELDEKVNNRKTVLNNLSNDELKQLNILINKLLD